MSTSSHEFKPITSIRRPALVLVLASSISETRFRDDDNQCFNAFCSICDSSGTKALEMRKYTRCTYFVAIATTDFTQWQVLAISCTSEEWGHHILTPYCISAYVRSMDHDFCMAQKFFLRFSSLCRFFVLWKTRKKHAQS